MWLARRPSLLPHLRPLLPSPLAQPSRLPLPSPLALSSRPPLSSRSQAQLAVTLPCLSQREEDYVKAQVSLALSACPLTAQSTLFPRTNGMSNFPVKAEIGGEASYQGRSSALHRCLAMGEAFCLSKQEMQAFLSFCGSPAVLKRFRGFMTFNQSLVQNYLMYNNIQPSDKPLTKTKGQRSWGSLVTADVKFKQKYRERLCEVIDQLGLQEFEDLPLELSDEADFEEFCQRFHSRMMTETCGIIHTTVLEKLMAKKLALGQTRTFDPINLVRNYYIFEHILDLDLDTSLSSLTNLTLHSSLDLVAGLNVVQQLVCPQSTGEAEEALAARWRGALHLCLEDQMLWAFPLGLAVRVLQGIGFSQEEREVLLLQSRSKRTVMADFHHICGSRFDGNVAAFMETMRRRLEIIRLEGVNLGIGNLSQMYKFLINWEEVIGALDRACVEDNQNPVFLEFREKDCFYNRRNSCKVLVSNSPSGSTKNSSGTLAYLGDLFGHSNKEDSVELIQTIKKVPHSRDVPLRVVHDAVTYLMQEGFSLAQLEVGCPILFYTSGVLERGLGRVDEQLGRDWREQGNALCVLNYFVEVDDMFSFSAIYDGIESYFARGKFASAVETEDEETSDKEVAGRAAEGEDSEDAEDTMELEEEDEDKEVASLAQAARWSKVSHRSPLLSPSLPATSLRAGLHTSTGRPGEEGRKGKGKVFYLQSPLTQLKVWLKFREVQGSWDPSITQEGVIEGARMAVVAIANRLQGGQWRELRGLLNRKEHKRLQKEVETEWDDVQRQSVALKEEDILNVVITDCRTQQIVQKKYLDVSLVVLARSPLTRRGLEEVVRLQVTLHREYTEGQLPDWIVTQFRVDKSAAGIQFHDDK